jgi:hypothetical protein
MTSSPRVRNSTLTAKITKAVAESAMVMSRAVLRAGGSDGPGSVGPVIGAVRGAELGAEVGAVLGTFVAPLSSAISRSRRAISRASAGRSTAVIRRRSSTTSASSFGAAGSMSFN